MKKPTALYPRLHVDAAPVGAVGQAGGVLLTRTCLLYTSDAADE